MSANQRRAFRLPVPDEQSHARLEAGGKRLSARLINTSATGFLLECPSAQVKQGDVVRLFTTSSGYEVRVAFIGSDAGASRIGVEVVRDLPDNLPAQASWLHLVLPRSAATALAGNGGLLLTGLALVGLVVLVTLAISGQAPFERRFEPISDLATEVDRVTGDFMGSLFSGSEAHTSAPPVFPRSTSSSTASPIPVPANFAALFTDEWRQGKVRQLRDYLELTQDQIRKLDELFARATAPSSQPAANSQPSGQPTIDQELANILTDEQKSKLESLRQAATTLSK